MTALLRTPLHLGTEKRDMWLAGRMGWPRMNVPDAPRIADPERRRRSKKLRLFKQIYFPRRLYPEFIEDQNGKFHGEFLDELEWLIHHLSVVYFAKAGPRGIGKTWDVDIAATYAICHHFRDMILRIELEADAAKKRTGAMKKIFESNPLLAEDFPEIIQPIHDFGGDPRSAHPLHWSERDLKFSNGIWHCARGIDGTLRGFNVEGIRPDLVIINDIESEETIRSETESMVRRARMEKEISALHGQGVACSYLYTQTVPAVGCLADEYTDQEKRADWNGRRCKMQIFPPVRPEMWEHYMQLCRTPAKSETDENRTHFQEQGPVIASELGMDPHVFDGLDFGYRLALEYYSKNKALMDEGIEMIEPMQHPAHLFYWFFAHKGEAWIASEFQNDPKSNPNVKDRQLVEHALMARRVETAAGIVPAWAAYVIVSADVGLYKLDWEVDAWSADGATSQLILQGITDTHVNDGGRWIGMTDVHGQALLAHESILAALRNLRAFVGKGFESEATGERIYPHLHGVDCGGTAKDFSFQETIYEFCAESGTNWIPLKGASNWSERKSERALSQNWECPEELNPGRRIDCNADHWKLQAFQAYTLPTHNADGTPYRGTRLLHMDTPHASLAEYCRQQTSEKHVTTILPGREVGKSQRVGWYLASGGARRNHKWDTCWEQFALIAILLWMQDKRKPRNAAQQPSRRPRSTPVYNPSYS